MRAHQQIGGVRGGLDQIRAVEVGARLGEGGDGEPVPGGDHLVVPARPVPPLAGAEQPGPYGGELRGVHEPLGVGQLEDGGALLEGALLGDPEVVGGERRVLLAQGLAQLLGRPHVVRPLHVPSRSVVAVGVEGGGEPALRGAQFVDHEVGGLQGDAPGELGAGGPPQVRVDAAQQRVVVEHLLEVRDGPGGVHRVAREAAAELVVDAAAGHGLAGGRRHLQGGLGAGAHMVAQQELQRHGRRELRRPAEAAAHGVELAGQPQQRGVQILGGGGAGRVHGQGPLGQVAHDAAGDLPDLLAAVGPGRADALQHLGGKEGMPCRGSGGK
ncbi:hypothetical protein GCM10020000_30040 [Streptomyces olivoverticillatus]